MKKLLLLFSTVVLSVSVFGQICTIDYSLTSVGIFPDTLPTGIVGEPYDEEIVFRLPTDTAGFNFTNFEIIDVAVPPGLDWQCSNDANGCNYDPQDDPFGCARAFGTPTVPGQYTIEISVIADLSIQSGNNTSFFVYMEVLPPVQENEGFTMTPGSGCDNVTIEFTNNVPSDGYAPIPDFTSGFVYSWDFGNGNQSNLENPNPQTYTSPGEYYIDYTAVIDTFGFFLSEVQVNSVSCTDVAFLYGNVDLYLELYDGDDVLVYTTESNPNDSDLPTTWNMNVMLDNPPYKLMVWDWDGDQLTGQAPDNCVDGDEDSDEGIDLVMPAVTAFGTTSNFGNNGGLNLTYKINKPTITIEVTDTLTVFEAPEAPIITINEDLGFATLETDDLGYSYQWFKDGEPIAGADELTLEIIETGDYWIIATNENGCASESNVISYTSTVNIEEVDGKIFKLYPNPASEIVTIELSDNTMIESVALIDVTGRVILHEAGEFNNEIQLNVAGQKPGYYIVQLSDGSATWKKKLVIQ